MVKHVSTLLYGYQKVFHAMFAKTKVGKLIKIFMCIFRMIYLVDEIIIEVLVQCLSLLYVGINGFPRKLELWFYMVMNIVLSHCHWL